MIYSTIVRMQIFRDTKSLSLNLEFFIPSIYPSNTLPSNFYTLLSLSQALIHYAPYIIDVNFNKMDPSHPKAPSSDSQNEAAQNEEEKQPHNSQQLTTEEHKQPDSAKEEELSEDTPKIEDEEVENGDENSPQQPEEIAEESKAKVEEKESHLNGEYDPNANPEPFEQTEVIEDYPMHDLYTKKRVPYIEKNNGSIMVKEKNYQKAIEFYNKALFSIKILTEDRELNVGEDYIVKVIKEVEMPINSNLTLCYLKTKDYENVIKYADKYLSVEPDSAKILYRKGMAYTFQKHCDFTKAKEALMKAYKIAPKDKMILDGLKTFKERKYEYKYKTQKICEKIFDKTSKNLYEDKKEESKEESSKEETKDIDKINGMQKGTIPYYIRTSLELGFAVPLVFYKFFVEKPATF